MSAVGSGWKLAQFYMFNVFQHGGGDSGGMIWRYIWWLMVLKCAVGYLSKDFCEEADYLHNKYIRVTDVYSEHDDDVGRRMKFYHLYGYANGAVILTNLNMI